MSNEFREKNNPNQNNLKIEKNSVSELSNPRTFELKNGDVVIIFDENKIKIPGYPTHYLNYLKLELHGKIIEDNIDFFKNYDFKKIKDLDIIDDEASTEQIKKIKKLIIKIK